LYSSAFLIAVDIETTKENLAIECIGYSAALVDPASGKLYIHSCVLPLDSLYAVSLMRKMNWNLKAPKVLQNGKYDHLYLARWSAPCYNWMYDTVTMFHSWYCELPKDLAFLTTFFVKKAQYWKDLAKTNDKYEYYRYNALDTYGTLLVAMEWLLQAPQWAKDNYLMEFPVNFPAHMCELTGIKQDTTRLKRAALIVNSRIAHDNIQLSNMVGTYPQLYNVNSAPQNAALRKILGAAHITSSDEKSLKKIGALHPLNKRITDKILDLRGDRKLSSTYLVVGKDLNGRILYALNPHGTDSGRLASRESAFWCGLQIQNIPRGKEVKQTIVADTGFRLCECDSSKAETWDTAYLSGDSALIAAVNSPLDFHKVNASAFFATPYDEVNKTLRDLAKRVNHGANYLMGPAVLVDTMGEAAIWKAKAALKLPQQWGLLDVAKYLLEQFHKTYPSLSATYYPAVVASVMTTRLLTGGQGWTRYCFGDPVKSKMDKNMYVAHRSQSENAIRLNRAFMRVFYEIALNPQYMDNFKLIAQIHDSILFQFRVGHEYLCEMVRERMELPVTVKGADGVVRTYTVPADVKDGKKHLGALRWSLTE
jgi:DNA polymerase I-like protein with 3'-5' exonuclease and polymerase domains